MTNTDARRKLQEIIIKNNLSEYSKGINVITCSIEDIKIFKKNIARRFHPDLYPNLSNKDIDTYKTINGLIATILKTNETNNNQTEERNTKTDKRNTNNYNKNNETIKDTFTRIVISKASKYKTYGDYIILKAKIELLIKSFLNRRIQLNDYFVATIEYELFDEIEHVFKEHFKKKLYDNINPGIKISEFYSKLKNYIDKTIENALLNLARNQYQNYEKEVSRINNLIIEKIAYLKTLTEKCTILKNKMKSAPDYIKKQPLYKKIFKYYMDLAEKGIDIEKINETIKYVSFLDKEYDRLLRDNINKRTSNNQKSHLYVPRKNLNSREFNDGLRYLDDSNNNLRLIDIGRVSIHILLSTKKVSPQELYNDYYLLEDYLQSCTFVGKTVVFPKFGMTMKDYLDNNLYDYATLLYKKEKDNLGLYVKDNGEDKTFYFANLSNNQAFKEESRFKGLIERYRNRDILVKDIEHYAKKVIAAMNSQSIRYDDLYNKEINYNNIINKEINYNNIIDKNIKK